MISVRDVIVNGLRWNFENKSGARHRVNVVFMNIIASAWNRRSNEYCSGNWHANWENKDLFGRTEAQCQAACADNSKCTGFVTGRFYTTVKKICTLCISGDGNHDSTKTSEHVGDVNWHAGP